MDNATVIERLRAALPEAIQKSAEYRGDLNIYVGPEAIVDVARFLRDDELLSYKFLASRWSITCSRSKTATGSA